MNELEAARVEGEAARGIRFRAVFLVADNRIAEIGQLHADLMSPAGLEGELDQGRFALRCRTRKYVTA